MTSALIPILFIEVALLILYFTVNSYVTNNIAKTFLSEATKNLNSMVSKEKININNQLVEITNYAKILQREHELFFSNVKLREISSEPPVFEFHKNGAYYKKYNNQGSALFYSSDTKMEKDEKDKAYYTEFFDTSFKSMVDSNPLVSQVYINTYDNMNRIYPFINNIAEHYGSVLKMSDYNFYYEADFMHNPTREPVWTKAYLDPAGMGWLISCIVPIYNGDFLEGVTGIDITVEAFIQHILNMKLPNESSAFMLDDTGTIMAMGDKVEQIMYLKELKNHVYSNKIEGTVLKPEEYNIFKHPKQDIRLEMGHVFRERIDSKVISISGKEYLVTQKIIPQTSWHLFVLTDMEALIKPIINIKKHSTKVGFMALGLMLVFYFFFFFYFKKNSAKIASKLCEPISLLTENTKYVGSEFISYEYEDSEIEEIDQLNKNFEEMTSRLERRTQELIHAEIKKIEQEQETERLLVVSITDPLTNVYNRLKIDEILDYEISQATRYSKLFSVIILDLDHFKMVNDKFGHQKGDHVLVQTAEILADNTRGSDTVARWGGEEFLIVCTNTDVDMVYTIAEKLRKEIEAADFGIDTKITASFGVAQYMENETKEGLIHRADTALYEAKRISRNLVVKSEI